MITKAYYDLLALGLGVIVFLYLVAYYPRFRKKTRRKEQIDEAVNSLRLTKIRAAEDNVLSRQHRELASGARTENNDS